MNTANSAVICQITITSFIYKKPILEMLNKYNLTVIYVTAMRAILQKCSILVFIK